MKIFNKYKQCDHIFPLFVLLLNRKGEFFMGTVKMEDNFQELEQRILEANSSPAFEKVKETIENTSTNTIVVGSGGSFAVAQYVKKSLNCFSTAMRPREMLCEKVEFADNVILATYSGKTPDIIQCIDHCKKYKNIKKITVLTWDGTTLREKTDLDNRVDIIEYKNNGAKEKSFISIASTLAPISLFTRYFVEQKGEKFDEYLKDTLNRAERDAVKTAKEMNFAELKENPFIEILYESEAKSAGSMLESNFTETGMIRSIMHEKKDFTHGRYTLGYKNNTPVMIWLKNSIESSYDKKLVWFEKEVWQDGRRFIVLESKDKGMLGEFELMVKGMYLTKAIAERLDVDISKIPYPKQSAELYNFDRDLI